MVYKLISKTESQVGKLVDINGDGIPEGIIFADLAFGGKTYMDKEIPTVKVDKLKDYISLGAFNSDKYGEKEMLQPILDGEDRFYIMAIHPIDYDLHTWWAEANADIVRKIKTSEDFGKGKENTNTVMKCWLCGNYGHRSRSDLWNAIQKEVEDGWFVPSNAEWFTFNNALKEKIEVSNCWTSFLGTDEDDEEVTADSFQFDSKYLLYVCQEITAGDFVRLAKTI